MPTVVPSSPPGASPASALPLGVQTVASPLVDRALASAGGAASGVPATAQMLRPGAVLTPVELRTLNDQFAGASTPAILEWIWGRFGPRSAVGTSFQGAGLVMLDLARRHGFRFPVFTLDTGLLFPETLELKQRLEDFFGFAIETVVPEMSVQEQAETQGPELWKRDPDLCCTVRKVLPLREKLRGLDCWVTGLRRDQSEARAGAEVVEVYHFEDTPSRDIVKVNPMVNWSREAVWAYLREHRIPYNPLHDRGYRSIGCQPCTRPTGAGEDERAGRWTGFKKVECGIHTFLPRKVDFQI